MPRVTVMVTTYPGGETYLEETLESLREQTYTDYNLYVVNDSRMDYPKCNDALDACDTEYIAFPHHDDIYQPTWLEEMVAALDAVPGAVAAFCFDRFINEDGRRIVMQLTPDKTCSRIANPLPAARCHHFKEIINALGNYGNFLRCETVMLRRKLVGDLRFDMTGRFGRAVDLAFWLRLAHEAGPIVLVDKELVWYRVHAAQGTSTQITGKPIDHHEAMRYGISLQPEVVDWNLWISAHRAFELHDQQKEAAALEARAH